MLFREKILIIMLFTGLFAGFAKGQQAVEEEGKIIVSRLMDSLWIHPSSFINHNDPNWIRLNQHLQNVDILQLNELIHSIYYGKNSFLLNRSEAYAGFIGTLNRTANDKKLKKFHRQIRKGFRNPAVFPDHKVVLIEGDSWFEYPVLLKDITDYLEKNNDFAIYSMAHGADWVSNMISNLQYEFVYVKIRPDVFVISGGGNDMVGDSRLSAFIRTQALAEDAPLLKDYRNYVLLRMMNKPVAICKSAYCSTDASFSQDSLRYFERKADTALLNQIVNGRRFLNKNFYRFLATIKLEYKMLFESLRKMDSTQFNSVKIITQGYDYAIPSYKRSFGAAILMKNGLWLKEPLMTRGVINPYDQSSIIRSIVFEINEMMIELGKEYNNIYHVDSREITAYYEKIHHRKRGSLWFDELHPKSKIFKIIAGVYSDIIENNIPDKQKVVNVIDLYKNQNTGNKKFIKY